MPIISFGQNANREIWQYFIPKYYIAYKANSKIIVDGKDSEIDWNQAEWTDNFVDIEGETKAIPYLKTNVKMLWDDSCIYFYAKLEEPDVWGDITERDAVIFHNNDFEIFIKPNIASPQYGEIEINALGTIWDLMLTKPYREKGIALNSWNIQGLKVAVNVDGTINSPLDKDNGWSVEIAIPRNALKELGFINNINKVPALWRINFSRVEWENEILEGKYNRKKDGIGNLKPENNWVWSQHGVIDMHQPEKWGFLKFSDKEPGTDVFEQDSSIGITLALFHLYTLEKQYFFKNGFYANNLQKLETLKFVFDGAQSIPSIVLTYSGFEIFFNLKYQQTRYIINQKGIIKKLKY